LLTVGDGRGSQPAPEPMSWRRGAVEAATAHRSIIRQAPPCRSGAPPFDCGAGFQVQLLLAQDAERTAPPPAPEVMLESYRAHLARRIRYFGPLTRLDLRI
jgi:hypothetical protein